MVVGKIIDVDYELVMRCPRCNKKIRKVINDSKLPEEDTKYEYTCGKCGLCITERITDVEWDK